MVTKKLIKNETQGIIDILVRSAEHTHKSKWNSSNNILDIELKEGGKLTIKFPSTPEGDFNIEGDKKGIDWVNKKEKKESQNITQADVNKSVFKKINLPAIKNGSFMHLDKNIDVFKEFDKYFSSLGFKKVGYHTQPLENINKAVFDTPTLIFAPYNISGASNELDSSYMKKYEKLKGYSTPKGNYEKITPITDEKTEDILLDKHKIGRHYPQRNVTLIWFNPFGNILHLKDVDSYTENEFLKVFLEDLKKVFLAMKIKKANNEKFKLRIMVDTFNAGSKTRISTLKSRITELDKHITDYEDKLCRNYTERESSKSQLNTLATVENNAVNDFIKEVEKIKKQKIIRNVTLENGCINITFKPTTVKAKLGRNVEGDESKGPMVEMFVGQITCHLHGDNTITVTSDHPAKNNQHPHAGDGNSKPCLGTGDGPNLMFKLIGERKFSDFIYVFWMWIRRYRAEDCYVAPHIYYDDRLTHGLPVFDKLGKRITINDPDKIKSGEQLKLKKASDYDENMKKYADFISQK